MNFNYKNQRSLFIICILLSFLTLHCAPSQKALEEKITQGGSEAAAFWLFIFPTLDFNQYCPPTDQIPILEPGTHSIFLSEGQSYLFDNRARLNGFTSSSDHSGKLFTFSFQENVNQNVKLESPNCGQDPTVQSSTNDSGKKGNFETVKIQLTNPFETTRRGNYVKLTSTIGSGKVVISTPTNPDPRF